MGPWRQDWAVRGCVCEAWPSSPDSLGTAGLLMRKGPAVQAGVGEASQQGSANPEGKRAVAVW